MKAYQIILPREESELKQCVANTRRKFFNVRINSFNDSCLTFLKLHKNIESVILHGKTFDRQQIAAILNETNQITSLTFNKVMMQQESAEEIEVVTLNQLENFTLFASDNNLLTTFSTNALKSFLCYPRSGNNSLVLELLSRQASLEELTIPSADYFFRNDVSLSLPFKLKCLNVNLIDLRRVANQFIKFLRLHLSTLKELSMMFCRTNEDVLGFVLRNANRIKVLEILVRDLPNIGAAEFWDGIEPILSVQELTVGTYFLNVDVARRFISLFPLLESFKSPHLLYGHLFNELPIMLPHLKQLKFSLAGADHRRLVFPRLKKLELDICQSNSTFISFINDHRLNLEEFTCLSTPNNSIFPVINECQNLKILRLSARTFVKCDTFDRLLQKTTSWILKFDRHRCASDVENINDLVFHFPDDKAIFKRWLNPTTYVNLSTENFWRCKFNRC